MTGNHMGDWQRCTTCGRPENDHQVRHPFQAWKQHPGNPEQGPRCGECRMGLGVHNLADPQCRARPS